MDALAFLLRSERAADPAYREWLAERLQTLNARQSSYAYALLPGLYFNWNERQQTAFREIAALIPAGESFIRVDEEQWASGGEVAGRRAIPFPATDGVYWGPRPMMRRPLPDWRTSGKRAATRSFSAGQLSGGWNTTAACMTGFAPGGSGFSAAPG